MTRHAKASQVEVSIRSGEEMIRMEIKDNGQGFEVDAANSVKKSNRLGLPGMQERVEMSGGTFQVESAPGQPITVRVEIPVKNGGRRKAIAVAM